MTKFSALSCAVFNSTGSEDLAALQLAHEGVSREHADRPVDQPNRFELVVNMKTAKALVITVSRMILVRVDRLVE